MRTNYLTLVNIEHPIYHPVNRGDLVSVSRDHPDILMERTAAEALKRLLSDIGAEGAIVPVSGWRPRKEQEQIWADTVAEKGVAFARKYVALPGCSEHETGLAIDLAENAPYIDFICPKFPRKGICQVFREMAPYYGFIERYQKSKEAVTGISKEPWHFRYVGTPHSEVIARDDLALEEYVERLSRKKALRRYCQTYGTAGSCRAIQMPGRLQAAGKGGV